MPPLFTKCWRKAEAHGETEDAIVKNATTETLARLLFKTLATAHRAERALLRIEDLITALKMRSPK